MSNDFVTILQVNFGQKYYKFRLLSGFFFAGLSRKQKEIPLETRHKKYCLGWSGKKFFYWWKGPNYLHLGHLWAWKIKIVCCWKRQCQKAPVELPFG
jgi:hypothetical protein